MSEPQTDDVRPLGTRIIDISPVLSERIDVWPGDVPYRREISLAIADGATVDLSAISSSLHLGAHADAPSHYAADGQTIAERGLDLYYGPCQVMRVEVERGARILLGDLQDEIEAPRLLLDTGTFPDPEAWNDDFAALSAELVEHAHARGVRLIGIDTPSVDLFDDKVLEAHRVLARHDMANLEGLILSHVDPGLYTLIALPLRIEGADGSPVRAVLVR